MIIDFQRMRGFAGAPSPCEAAPADVSELDRAARLLRTIGSARQARQALNTGLQAQIARWNLDQIGQPRSPHELALYVRSSELLVDAHSNDLRHPEAIECAQQTRELAAELDPRSVAAHGADRQLARALELAGSPDEAMHRQLAGFQLLRRADHLGEAGWIEQLLHLQGVLTAAKRDGGRQARDFATFACQTGERLAAELESFLPDVVAYYRQWHGFALAWLSDRESGTCAARQTLSWALEHRRDSVRDRLTAGMLLGEIALLDRRRPEAIQIFATTVSQFAERLPRKYVSAQQMLRERDLLAA